MEIFISPSYSLMENLSCKFRAIPNVVRLLSRFFTCCWAISWLGVTPAAAETLRVGGTGSSAPLIERLFEEFRRQNPAAVLDQVRPPLGTRGSLRALAGGRVDIALLGRSPSPEEAKTIGSSFPLADTALVFASQGGRRPQGFTLEELAAVYAGHLKNWDDGTQIRLVLRASTESDTLVLKSMSPNMATAVEAAAKRSGMVIGEDDLDTAELLKKVPGSLGPTTLGLLSTLGLRLNQMPLNGIHPTPDNLKSGHYPWHKTLFVALPTQPSRLTEAFVTYLKSEQAARIMRRHEYLPLAQ